MTTVVGQMALGTLSPWPTDSLFHSIFYSTKNRAKNRAVWPPCRVESSEV